MIARRLNASAGFARRDLFVCLAVLVIFGALGVVGLARVRESAIRVRCDANMMKLGLALTAYHESKKVFPTDDDSPDQTTGPRVPFYADILPFIGEGSQDKTWRGAPRAVQFFLCPSRRTVEVGPKADYAGGHSPNWWVGGAKQSILGNWVGPYPGKYRNSLSIADVQNGDGASNTLLLAHKSMDPKDYNRSDNAPHDISWADTTTYWDHKRCPFGFTKDRNGGNRTLSSCSNLTDSAYLIGSPHPGSLPCLFADNSVRSLGYDIAPSTCSSLWAYNDDFDSPEP